jgi:F-type H+-transporting ATPase subunit epsilon
MAQSMKLDILTPLGPVREGVDVAGVQVPGILGELGILPQHESFITAVVPGVVRFREGAQSVRIAVGAGFLEVKDTGRVVILVERALAPSEIDSGKARTELEEVKRELAAYSGPITSAKFRDLDTRRAWLEAQLRATAG